MSLKNANNPATLSAFRLDSYEITVGRFRAFVNAGLGTQQNPPSPGAGAHPLIAGSGWDPAWNASLLPDTKTLTAKMHCNVKYAAWTDAPGPNERRPMNCLTWYEAFAFCAWDGGRLPTDAEWNYAAAGGDEQRVYPWSSPASSTLVDPAYASYADANGDCLGDGATGCTLDDVLYVGSKPLGNARWGQADLGGNLWEWVLDWYSPTLPMPCADCANVASGTQRTVRGGGYFTGISSMRAGYREGYVPNPHDGGFGARCARDP